MSFIPFMSSCPRPLCLFALLALTLLPAQAFNLIKNVNDGKPRVEKLVIFDKARGTANKVSFVTDNAPTAINADGAIQCDITGNKKMRMEIHWEPQGDLKETFDATQYSYLILTCKVGGVVHKTDAKSGKISDMPRTNMFFSVILGDKDNQPVGYANLADLTDDAKTPEEMVTLTIPMSLFTRGSGFDVHNIKSLNFPWGDTHDDLNRDLHLVIEKIALAD